MNKLIKFLAFLLVVLLLLLIPAYYFFNAKVKDQIIPQSKKFIQEQTDLDIDFKSFRLSLSKLLKLEPSIKIEDLRIEEAVSIKQIYIELSLAELLQREFNITEILIDGANIVLEENARKEVLLKGFKAPSTTASSKDPKQEQSSLASNKLLESLSLDSLRVINSRIEFNPYRSVSAIEIKPVELELKDLEISESKTLKAKYQLSAQVLNSRRSGLKAEGELGPIDFSFKSVPLFGQEKLSLYLSDISEKDRKELLGDLVRVKKDTAILQESEFKGDLMKLISGQGQVRTNNFIIGNSAEHNLELVADLPHSYKLELIKSPNLKLESKNSSLSINTKDKKTGHLSFDTYIMTQLDTGYLQGSSRGKLEGLELREVLNSVSEQRDLISGTFEIDNYQIYFKGKDADELSKSLKGNGFVSINNGSLYILKSITKYKDIAANFIANPEEVADKISGKFSSLTSGFNLKPGGDLYTDPVELKTKALNITGSGSIKSNELSYNLDLAVSGIRNIPIKIRGSLEKPKVYPDIKQLGKEQGQKLINDALKFGLDALIRNAKPPADTTNP